MDNLLFLLKQTVVKSWLQLPAIIFYQNLQFFQNQNSRWAEYIHPWFLAPFMYKLDLIVILSFFYSEKACQLVVNHLYLTYFYEDLNKIWKKIKEETFLSISSMESRYIPLLAENKTHGRYKNPRPMSLQRPTLAS